MSRIVIVGLGDTGVLTARHLGARHHLTAITASPGLISGQELGLRLSRPERWRGNYFLDYERFQALDRVRRVSGEATALDLTRRVIQVGDHEVDYDYLVIATGVRNGFWRQPQQGSLADAWAQVRSDHHDLARAAKVLVVGGGSSAVSAAINLQEGRRPGSVVLAFPGSRPLTRHHPRVWNTLAALAKRRGVDVKPDHRALVPTGGVPQSLTNAPVAFEGQPTITADVVLWAIGPGRPLTEWLPADLLDQDGFVKVSSTLQATKHPEVFAVGDVAACDPLRTSARNGGPALVAANIERMERGRPLRTYRPRPGRWGSVIGPQADGLAVFDLHGRGWRIPRVVLDRLITPYVVNRGIYGGIRPDSVVERERFGGQ